MPQDYEPSCAGTFQSTSLPPHSAWTSSASLSGSYGKHVKNLSEDKAESIPCSPLIYQGSLFIGEGYQVVKSQQTLGESMLTTPDHFVILHVLGNAFQDYLLYHLPTI